jgi:integrase
MKKPYRFWKRPSGVYYVMYAIRPGKWISTGQKKLKDAEYWAEQHRTDKKETSQIFQDFADGFFIPGRHKWIKIKNAKNKTFGSDFLQVNQGRLDNYILPHFGPYILPAIKPRAIDDWLIDLEGIIRPLSGATKNKILITFRHVLQEAKNQELIESNPAAEVEMITENKKKRTVFTSDEIKALFPESDDEIQTIWLTKSWELYFGIETCCGLRPGEVSALTWEDFYPDLHGLVINKSVDSRTGLIKGIKTEKTGMDVKAAIITDYLVQELKIIQNFIEPKDTDLIFPSINGNTIKAEVSNKHFKASCDRAGINRNGRTQYSLRHTFDTELLKKLSRETVQDLMGHTNYRKDYDHRTGEDLLIQYQNIIPIIESRF